MMGRYLSINDQAGISPLKKKIGVRDSILDTTVKIISFRELIEFLKEVRASQYRRGGKGIPDRGNCMQRP